MQKSSIKERLFVTLTMLFSLSALAQENTEAKLKRIKNLAETGLDYVREHDPAGAEKTLGEIGQKFGGALVQATPEQLESEKAKLEKLALLGPTAIHIDFAQFGNESEKATEDLKNECDSFTIPCPYAPSSARIGDPFRTSKRFVARWTCGAIPQLYDLVNGENGSRDGGVNADGKTVTLTCPGIHKYAPSFLTPDDPHYIHIIKADFGVKKNNATADVQFNCEGLESCHYNITTVILGDPDPSSSKRFYLEWTCGKSTELHAFVKGANGGENADETSIDFDCY